MLVFFPRTLVEWMTDDIIIIIIITLIFINIVVFVFVITSLLPSVSVLS
jgi:hypothetical protein